MSSSRQVAAGRATPCRSVAKSTWLTCAIGCPQRSRRRASRAIFRAPAQSIVEWRENEAPSPRTDVDPAQWSQRTYGEHTLSWQVTVPQPGSILIVDDEPKIRSFIGRALSAAGYATEFAASGTEGPKWPDSLKVMGRGA